MWDWSCLTTQYRPVCNLHPILHLRACVVCREKLALVVDLQRGLSLLCPPGCTGSHIKIS